ncbi:thiolase family protein [Nocardioides litoris]|uniref:thiolase family protein n=1 Tax=Nocardioides litoris TaxID=1926648 RepID=UPI00111D2AA5|nr:thiolase family protein [Nocardioides litoris]
MSVSIVGIGMHPFGRHGLTGKEQGVVAVSRALHDAGVTWDQVQFAFGGSDAAGNPDTMVSDLGLTGLSFVNVRNGCATGGSAITLGVQAILAGAGDIGVVVGYDKHPPGAFNARPSEYSLGDWYGESGLMLTTQFFAMKIQRYADHHGISASTLAKVAEKAFANGALNNNAWRRSPLTEQEILASPMVSDPLTKYMWCSPGEGAVALVICRDEVARRLTTKPIRIGAVRLRSRRFGSFEVFSPGLSAERGVSPSVDAARATFEAAGVGPEDMDLAQLQDTEAGAEVMHLAETGFCSDGDQERLVQDGETRIGGRLPVNTDGGCIANGEPIGASGLRQVYENVLQLRGDAGPRQVPGHPRAAFTHVYGAPGISACTVLTR